MPDVDINLWAVLLAALVNIVIGSLWYSKPLFGKAWSKLVGLSDEQMKSGATTAYIGAIVYALVLSYVLAHAVQYVGAETISEGLMTGFWAWFGFVATTSLAPVLFEKKPMKWYLISNGYNLVSFLLMGLILARWQ